MQVVYRYLADWEELVCGGLPFLFIDFPVRGVYLVFND